MLLGRRPEDRFTTAVFLAALLHGRLIMGVRCSAPAPDDTRTPMQKLLDRFR